MAVTKVGTAYNDTTIGAGSESISSITIDADCKLSVVIAGSSELGPQTVLDILNWDSGADIETGWTRGANVGGDGMGLDSYTMLEGHANHPAAGSTNQTLTWSFDQHNYGAGWISLFFLDGVDTDDPINDTIDSSYQAAARTGWTATLANVTTDEDMAIVAAVGYYAGAMSSLAEQNNIFDQSAQLAGRVDYEIGENSPGLTWSSVKYTAGIAFAINAAAAGGETKTITTDLDALLQKTLTSTFSLDSLLQKTIPVSLSLDGILVIIGTTCWGYDTDVSESNVRNFSVNWTGTGAISGSADDEIITLDYTEYMESEVVNIGTQLVKITLNKYGAGSGPAATVEYKDGNSMANCESDSWNSYTVPFVSTGYVKIKVTAP